MPKNKEALPLSLSHTNNCLAGFRLRPQTVSKLERELKNDPANLLDRLNLLGFYLRGHRSKAQEKKRLQIVLLMIENIPENKILETD